MFAGKSTLFVRQGDASQLSPPSKSVYEQEPFLVRSKWHSLLLLHRDTFREKQSHWQRALFIIFFARLQVLFTRLSVSDKKREKVSILLVSYFPLFLYLIHGLFVTATIVAQCLVPTNNLGDCLFQWWSCFPRQKNWSTTVVVLITHFSLYWFSRLKPLQKE